MFVLEVKAVSIIASSRVNHEGRKRVTTTTAVGHPGLEFPA